MQGPASPVETPYKSNIQVVSWIGDRHEAHPSVGPPYSRLPRSSSWFDHRRVGFPSQLQPDVDTISDLGETSCGRYGSAMCSPRWWLMDYAGFFCSA